jgi:hypothetical protein
MSGVRSRLLPALLTALGVTFLAVGLLTYTTPVPADAGGTAIVEPTPTPALETPFPRITLPPLGSAIPSSAPTAPADRVATRVRVAALDIDLPIVKPGDPNDYPLCNVAMWIGALGQPGEGRATYLYAHARTGMFLPLLTSSQVKNGKRMLGMVVEIWTSDDQRFLYEITDVRRHEKTLDDALAATSEQLWLQTSEGPKGPPGVVTPKLQIVAKPLSQEASDHASAHPKPHPVVCG